MNKKRLQALAGLTLGGALVVAGFQNCQKAPVSAEMLETTVQNLSVTDITAPKVQITKAPAAFVNENHALVEYNAQDDVGGALTYDCKLDQVKVSCSEMQAQLEHLTEQTHTFSVQVAGGAGNKSTAAQTTFLVDTTAPTVNFIAPLPATDSDQSFFLIRFEGQDTGSGLDHFECLLDKVAKNPCSSPFSFTVAEGAHKFQVVAVDRAGNVSVPAVFNWTYTKRALLTSNVLGITGAQNMTDTRLDNYLAANSPGVHFTAVDYATNYTVRITQGATAVETMAGMGLAQDGHLRMDFAATNPARYVHGQVYSVAITAAYNAQETTSANFNFTADLKGPVHAVTIPAIALGAKDVTLGLSIADDVSGVESALCTLKMGATTESTINCLNKNSLVYTGLAYGVHILTVASVDKAGNKNSTTHQFETKAVSCEFGQDPTTLACNEDNFPIRGSIYYVQKSVRDANQVADNFNSLYKIVLVDNAQVKKSATTLLINQINTPAQNFADGFKTSDGTYLTMEGSTDKLQEWFGLDLAANIQLGSGDSAGTYEFAIVSDDGSELLVKAPGATDYKIMNSWVDQTAPRLICPQTGASVAMTTTTKLPMKLRWTQGPKERIALQLFWRKAGASGNVDCATRIMTNDPDSTGAVEATMKGEGWKLMKIDNFSKITN